MQYRISEVVICIYIYVYSCCRNEIVNYKVYAGAFAWLYFCIIIEFVNDKRSSWLAETEMICNIRSEMKVIFVSIPLKVYARTKIIKHFFLMRLPTVIYTCTKKMVAMCKYTYLEINIQCCSYEHELQRCESNLWHNTSLKLVFIIRSAVGIRINCVYRSTSPSQLTSSKPQVYTTTNGQSVRQRSSD